MKRIAINAALTVAELPEGLRLEFRVARRLESPNDWRRHHLSGHKLMTWWRQAFEQAIALHRGSLSVAGYEWAWRDQLDPIRPFRGLPRRPKLTPTIPRELRRRVRLVRQVPHARNFLQDEDDLRYTTKPINDALKNAGIIREDSRAFLEQDTPEQEVTGAGYWTLVIVEPAAGDYVVPPARQAEAPPLPAVTTGGRVSIGQLRDLLLAGAAAHGTQSPRRRRSAGAHLPRGPR